VKGELSKLSQELQKAKTENSATLNELQTIDTILTQVKDLDTALTSSEANLISSAEKAKQIKDKIARLTRMLLKSKKEHGEISNELLTVKQRVDEIREEAQAAGRDSAERDFREQKEKEMKALREQIKSFFTENSELEQNIEDTEAALSLAKDAQEKYKLELDLSRSKYDESQKEALNLKAEVTQLQTARDGSKRRDSAERDFREQKEKEMKTLREQIKSFFTENSELEQNIEDTEAALSLAKDAQEKYKLELDLSRSKYDESQKEALNLKAEVTQLQTARDGSKRDQISLRSELDNVNR
jgi:chromosome segregation ATPase